MLICVKSEAVFLIDLKHIPSGARRQFRLPSARSVEPLCITLAVTPATGWVLSRWPWKRSLATGTCNAQIQEWHPRAQGVLAGLGLAPRKRSRGLKIHLTPSERGYHPRVTGGSAGAWEDSDIQCECTLSLSGSHMASSASGWKSISL